MTHWAKLTDKNLEGVMVSDRGDVADERGQKITQKDHAEGYKRVSIRGHRYYVHRLVMRAFFPTDNKSLVVDHIDGNRANNNANNLRWVTRRQNTQKAGREGKLDTSSRRNVPIMLTDAAGVSYVYGSQAEASRVLHIPDCSINKCLKGHRKTVRGYIAKYL